MCDWVMCASRWSSGRWDRGGAARRCSHPPGGRWFRGSRIRAPPRRRRLTWRPKRRAGRIDRRTATRKNVEPLAAIHRAEIVDSLVAPHPSWRAACFLGGGSRTRVKAVRPDRCPRPGLQPKVRSVVGCLQPLVAESHRQRVDARKPGGARHRLRDEYHARIQLMNNSAFWAGQVGCREGGSPRLIEPAQPASNGSRQHSAAMRLIVGCSR